MVRGFAVFFFIGCEMYAAARSELAAGKQTARATGILGTPFPASHGIPANARYNQGFGTNGQ